MGRPPALTPSRFHSLSRYPVSRMFAALEAASGCGLLDHLIADDYRRSELITLTLDRKMAALPQTRYL